MAKVYINIHSGPELKNKATLGLLVAVNAQKKGHDVRVFFAADGVHLMNCKEKGEIVGQSTGDVKEHLDHLKETNTKIYVSGMSAKARGYDENILKEYDGDRKKFAQKHNQDQDFHLIMQSINDDVTNKVKENILRKTNTLSKAKEFLDNI